MANELFEAPWTAILQLQGCYCFASITFSHKLGQEDPLHQKKTEQPRRAWAEARQSVFTTTYCFSITH